MRTGISCLESWSRCSILANGDKNKARMDKRQEVRNILNDLRRGHISWVKAQDKICALLDVVGRSKQFYFLNQNIKGDNHKCDFQCKSCSMVGKQ